jgi:hypothetical protein
VQVQAAVHPGEAYSLICSANFKTWLVVTNFMATNESMSVTDSVCFPQQFYRLRTPP